MQDDDTEDDAPDPPKNKGGRPPGSKNKRALADIEKARNEGELPHEFLLRLARGGPIRHDLYDAATGEITENYVVPSIEQRHTAAKDAAPYYAPKLSAVEVIGNLADEALDSVIVRLAAEAGVSLGALGALAAREGQAGTTRERRSARTSEDKQPLH